MTFVVVSHSSRTVAGKIMGYLFAVACTCFGCGAEPEQRKIKKLSKASAARGHSVAEGESEKKERRRPRQVMLPGDKFSERTVR